MKTHRWRWLVVEDTPFSTAAFVGVWLLALVAYGVGDVVTTIAIVWFSPLLVEANPVVASAIDAFGGGGFLAVKLLAIYAALFLSLWAGIRTEDRFMFYGPPLLLVCFGVITTGVNLALLL